MSAAKPQSSVDEAASYLKRAGLRVLDREWMCPAICAIDLVASDRGVLVACVVRYARAGVAADYLAVSMCRRQRRAAVQWAKDHAWKTEQIRVDVITVSRDPAHGFRLEHVRGVEPR